MEFVIVFITSIKNKLVSVIEMVVHTVSSVLGSLGVNDTVWIQLAITFIFLLIVRYVFIKDLTRVLTQRELNTQGAIEEAEKLHQEADVTKKRYEKILNENIVQLNNEYAIERKSVKDEIDKNYKIKEESVLKEYKNSIDKKVSEFSALEKQVQGGAQILADELLQKIRQ